VPARGQSPMQGGVFWTTLGERQASAWTVIGGWLSDPQATHYRVATDEGLVYLYPEHDGVLLQLRCGLKPNAGSVLHLDAFGRGLERTPLWAIDAPYVALEVLEPAASVGMSSHRVQ
jgi:hypothetical protein